MDSQFLAESVERSDANSYKSPKPRRTSIASSSGCGCLQNNICLNQPISRLTLFTGAINKVCGAVLVLTGGLGIFDAVRHGVIPSLLSTVLLSVYVAGFGAMLLRHEFAAARDAGFKRDCGFMYSHVGRCFFVLLCANLAWTVAPLGVYAALLTNANALFNLCMPGWGLEPAASSQRPTCLPLSHAFECSVHGQTSLPCTRTTRPAV